MAFQKYSSLENHTNGKFLAAVFDYLDANGLRNELFVAREKIHGTNFSVIITADSISPAKRSGPITETEKFFGYEDLMAKYQTRFKEIQSAYIGGEITQIQIFGEYAGGGIQKEVDYGEKDFYVFDVIFTKNGTEALYMADDFVTKLCFAHHLKMAPVIGLGTIDELLKLPVEYDTVVNEYDKLFEAQGAIVNQMKFEQPEAKDNVSEGLVIKPVTPMFLRTGGRIAIKYKTDKFKEKGKGKAPAVPVPLPAEDLALLEKFSEFVTWNRVSNVISHIGEVTSKDFGKVLGLTMRDIFVEAEREGIEISQAQQPSKLKNELQKLVQAEIRTKWLEIIS